MGYLQYLFNYYEFLHIFAYIGHILIVKSRRFRETCTFLSSYYLSMQYIQLTHVFTLFPEKKTDFLSSDFCNFSKISRVVDTVQYMLAINERRNFIKQNYGNLEQFLFNVGNFS